VEGWAPARREGEIVDWLEQAGRLEEPWIAIDDQGWQFALHRDRLVECVFHDGLDERVEALLREKLNAMRGSWAMTSMSYKGYTARIELDERDHIFVGRVLGVRDIISFHARSVAELRAVFVRAVDDYLADCAEQGVPAKPGTTKERP
jgi:hypothetical protein